ncbi:unnamed protein product [Polarella glacialis]|uniref:Pentatricopeptide repeat-containing protein, chloroplastic n=2 Tax=Polarella glacialis TaxID=89957 RepID=A0A813HNU0_POLGL|nr:unnamed protein product [Polarella glacialis]
MMGAQGVARNSVTCTQGLGACGVAGRWAQALQLLGIAQDGCVEVGVIAHNAAAAAAEKAGNWAAALALISALATRGASSDAAGIGSAVQACAAGGAWTLALQLLRLSGEGQSSADAASLAALLTECEQRGLSGQQATLVEQLLSPRHHGWADFVRG